MTPATRSSPGHECRSRAEERVASLQQHNLQLLQSNAEWDQRHTALLLKHRAEIERWKQEHSEETVASLRRCNSQLRQSNTTPTDDLAESQDLAKHLTACTSFLQDKM